MKKIIILLFVATVFMYACNTTKSLETEVTMSIDSKQSTVGNYFFCHLLPTENCGLFVSQKGNLL